MNIDFYIIIFLIALSLSLYFAYLDKSREVINLLREKIDLEQKNIHLVRKLDESERKRK